MRTTGAVNTNSPVDEVLNWPSTHNMSRLKLRRITLCSGLIAEQRLRQRAATGRQGRSAAQVASRPACSQPGRPRPHPSPTPPVSPTGRGHGEALTPPETRETEHDEADQPQARRDRGGERDRL